MRIAAAALQRIIPAIESSVKGKDFRLTQAILTRVDQALDDISSHACPELKKLVVHLKKIWHRGNYWL